MEPQPRCSTAVHLVRNHERVVPKDELLSLGPE
jgi:hypothetical protein